MTLWFSGAAMTASRLGAHKHLGESGSEEAANGEQARRAGKRIFTFTLISDCRLTPELSRTALRPWAGENLLHLHEAAKRARLERIVRHLTHVSTSAGAQSTALRQPERHPRRKHRGRRARRPRRSRPWLPHCTVASQARQRSRAREAA